MKKMKLTILGSGTFVPELERSCSSYLLEKGDEKILFDFGRGSIRNLLKLKISLHEISNIFISHMHADHISELIPFTQLILDFPEKNKLKEKYVIYGPEGIKKDLNKVFEGFGFNKSKLKGRIKIIEMRDSQEIKLNDFIIQAFGVVHSKSGKCLAYRINEGDKLICYSGDSTNCERLKKACKNVDMGIIEATTSDQWGLPCYLDGISLGILAQESKIRGLVVTHVANSYLNQVKKDIKKNYLGKLSIAKDLMEIKI